MRKNLPFERWARLIRQLAFIPMLHNKWLTKTLKDELAYSISHAESGHRGEICLIIENRLPILCAFHTDCRERAIELFSQYRVWDTADNTGILIYVNLCEHKLEIVADRGIDKKVPMNIWNELCQTSLEDFSAGEFREGLLWLIQAVGELIRYHYPAKDDWGNELSNQPIHL